MGVSIVFSDQQFKRDEYIMP